jgi:hypothetical protein
VTDWKVVPHHPNGMIPGWVGFGSPLACSARSVRATMFERRANG